jgi:ribosomal protein L11 methylase PrmA
MSEHDELMDFLADGLRAHHHLSPQTLATWRRELYREIERRGGVEGDSIVRAVMADVLRELVERGNRRVRNELTVRLSGTMSEDDAERLDTVLSDILADVLERLK